MGPRVEMVECWKRAVNDENAKEANLEREMWEANTALVALQCEDRGIN